MPASVFRDPFVDAGLAPAATAHVLALDHELANPARAPDVRRAREHAWARVLTIDGDGARFSADPRRFDGWLGLLVLDGFALRDEVAAQATQPEVLDLTPSAAADALDSLLAGEQLRRDPAGGWLVPVQA